MSGTEVVKTNRSIHTPHLKPTALVAPRSPLSHSGSLTRPKAEEVELPLLLLHAGGIEELKRDVLGKEKACAEVCFASCLQPRVRIHPFCCAVRRKLGEGK